MSEKVIVIISKKCQEIIDKRHKISNARQHFAKPTFIISTIYKKGYLLTYIGSDHEQAYYERQSEFISLDTDLEQLLETLYNRTT